MIREYYAAWDAGDPDAIAAFFADDFSTTYTDWMGEEVRVAPADVHDWIAGWLDSMAEMTHQIHELVAEGDQVVANVTYRAIHDGTIHGIEPTGNTVEVEEYLRFRLENGTIVELDWVSDDLSLLTQLGLTLPIEA
ncbi:ester cyclase [Halovivax limisalsi]|uniref:ester cyclase n=1 Tax=Halovivax limisalsi TaxID=1453760 RepID=UPI001FFD0C4F|nr:ester cyclase [Halovivax limisalsi]